MAYYLALKLGVSAHLAGEPVTAEQAAAKAQELVAPELALEGFVKTVQIYLEDARREKEGA